MVQKCFLFGYLLAGILYRIFITRRGRFGIIRAGKYNQEYQQQKMYFIKAGIKIKPTLSLPAFAYYYAKSNG